MHGGPSPGGMDGLCHARAAGSQTPSTTAPGDRQNAGSGMMRMMSEHVGGCVAMLRAIEQ